MRDSHGNSTSLSILDYVALNLRTAIFLRLFFFFPAVQTCFSRNGKSTESLFQCLPTYLYLCQDTVLYLPRLNYLLSKLNENHGVTSYSLEMEASISECKSHSKILVQIQVKYLYLYFTKWKRSEILGISPTAKTKVAEFVRKCWMLDSGEMGSSSPPAIYQLCILNTSFNNPCKMRIISVLPASFMMNQRKCLYQ